MGNQPDKSFCGRLLSACGDGLICSLIHTFSLFALRWIFFFFNFHAHPCLKKKFSIWDQKAFFCILNGMKRFRYIKWSSSVIRNDGATCSVTNGAGRPAWRPHLEQICVWQTFGLLTTQRQGPSCSTGVRQLGTQMGLWESLAWCLPKPWCNACSRHQCFHWGHLHKDRRYETWTLSGGVYIFLIQLPTAALYETRAYI